MMEGIQGIYNVAYVTEAEFVIYVMVMEYYHQGKNVIIAMVLGFVIVVMEQGEFTIIEWNS